MFSCSSRLLAAALLALAAWPAGAQQPLTLQEAQRLALARSRQIAAVDAAARALDESAVAAGQLPDPVLKASVQNLPVNGPDRFSLSRDFMTMRSIGVMQELTGADKRRLRMERVRRDADRVQAERAEAVANVQRDTALAWIERRYALAMADLMRRQLEQAQLEVQAAEIAYRGGRGTQAEFFAARTAWVNLQDRLRQSERQAQSAALTLARWAGPEAAARPLDDSVDWDKTDMAAFLSGEHFRHLPHVAVLAAQVQAAQTELQLAQANARADWTVEAMVSQRGAAYSNMVSVGITIPLQIDRTGRQNREVAAKAAALEEAQARYEDALRMHETELRVMAGDWTAGRERVRLLDAQLVPAARLRSQAALTAYQSGKGSLAAVLAARREEVDARLQVLNLQLETARLWARLNYLIPDPKTLPPAKEQP